jgi:cell division protein FtsQ
MTNWKKFIIITLDVIIGIYLVLAITAFNKPDEHASVCSEVRINIEATDPAGFLNESDIRQLLAKNHILPIGQPMKKISVRQIEEKLRANAMIEKADCYKTQSGHICINIRQRTPIVRIMAQNGDDYYVDTKGGALQATGYACDVIVATGNITHTYASKHLTPMANLIMADKFWRNQIVQFNVLDDGSVEVVPRVGNHIIYIGQPTGVERKLSRLRKFYLYGLSQAGWNKYSRINVEFDNQIICKRK